MSSRVRPSHVFSAVETARPALVVSVPLATVGGFIVAKLYQRVEWYTLRQLIGRAAFTRPLTRPSKQAHIMDQPRVRLHRWDEIALDKVTEMISRKIVTGEREMV